MQHLDPDDLALLALGENLGDAVDAHVATCATCRDEIESFRMTVGLAELSNYGEDAPRPGEHVWAAIATELGLRQQRGRLAGLYYSAGSLGAIAGSVAGGVIAQWVGLPNMFRVMVVLMLAVALVIGKVMPRLRSVQPDPAGPLGAQEARHEV